MIGQSMAILCALSLSVRAVTSQDVPPKWPHESSDLKVDSRIHYGSLRSGLRYAWVNQKEAESEEIRLRLHLDVGSLVELDKEQGVAHFVEHMAFNGTRNFKAGTLVEWFQAHGVRFGHDVNAHTSNEETVYELDLPDAEPERLEKAFTWMHDVADGMLFAESEVQKEKGVIDAEERERSSLGMRVWREVENHLIGDTLYPRRWPIGVKSVRDKFNSSLCKAFYRKWYRPEHMMLVVAGKLGELDVEKLIHDHFASVAAPKEPLPQRPKAGTAAISARAFSVYDKEARGCTLTVAKVGRFRHEPDSLAGRQSDIVREISTGLMNAALYKLGESKDCPFDSAGLQRYVIEDQLDGHALVVECEPQKWREALAAAGRELHRVMAEGFDRDQYRAMFQSVTGTLTAVPELEKRPGASFAEEILEEVRTGMVPIDEKTTLEILRKVQEEFSEEKLHQALKEQWKEGELYLFVAGGLDLGADAAKALTQAWEAGQSPAGPLQSEEKPAEPPADSGASSTSFAYGAKGAEGELKAEDRIDDLGLTRIEFDNGVRATLRESKDQKAMAILYVRFGEGMLALDPAEADVGWVANNVFIEGGLGQHEFKDLGEMLAGGQLSFSVGHDASIFYGAAARENVQRLCELICAFFSDPGWRQGVFDEFMEKLPETFESYERGFRGPSGRFDRKLHSGDLRFGIPDRQQVESFLFDTVREFLQPQLEEGPIEIAMVGGMPVDTMRRLLARTFGMLPERREREVDPERLKTPPIKSGLKLREEIDSADKSALLRIVFPMTDGMDPALRRQLAFLREIVDDHLRTEIREKRGAAYSPEAYLYADRVFRGVGSLEIRVECDPAKVNEVLSSCLAVAEGIGRRGVNAEEVERVRTIANTNHKKNLDRDQFWINGLAEALRNQEAYDDLRRAESWYDGITAEQVSALAKKYLVRARASTCMIVPKQLKK